MWANAAILKIDPISVFLILSILFGIIFVFLVPPFEAPDEQAHFYRSYQLSELHVYGTSKKISGVQRYGDELPKSVHADVLKLMGNIPGQQFNTFSPSIYSKTLGTDLNQNNKEFVAFEGTEIYSPVPYVPQAIGVSVGKIFGLSPLCLLWLGRLFNLAAWIACIYLALKLFPFAKWAVVALALNPLALFLASSQSADGLTIGFAFIFVALVLNYLKNNTLLTAKQLAYLAILICLIPLTKPTNIIICLLIFILPWQIFGSMKKFLLFCFGILGASMLITMAWALSVSNIIHDVSNIYQPGMGVSSREQIHFIMNHPLGYLKILFKNYILGNTSNGDEVLRSFNGVFGWLDSAIPLWSVILQFNVLFLALLYQFGRGLSVTLKRKLFIGGILVTASGALISALYVGYTRVGSVLVAGVQGRYFIPLSILVTPLFTGKKKILNMSEKSMGIIMSSSICLTLLITTTTLFLRYYR